jgi:hypothetical protein
MLKKLKFKLNQHKKPKILKKRERLMLVTQVPRSKRIKNNKIINKNDYNITKHGDNNIKIIIYIYIFS